MSDAMQSEKIQASKWFAKLRDQIVAAFETLEDSHDSQTQLAGRF